MLKNTAFTKNSCGKMASTKVHRCRFIDWKPSGIVCLAASMNHEQIALARGNGNIEIWSVRPTWYLECTIVGNPEAGITALAWTQDGEEKDRLFSTCVNGTIFEIDMELLCHKKINDSFGGAIWAMQLNRTKKIIYVGCEDGRIRTYGYDNDDLFYVSALSSSGERVISLALHRDGKTMFAGGSEGIISKWNLECGRNESRITMDNYHKEKPIVWCLLVLDDYSVVSGDSAGNVHVYDGHTCTLLQTFSQLTADVLALAVNPANNMLFASGIDSQVISIRKNKSNGDKWAYSYSHRAHSHDVRALVVVPDFGTKKQDIVMSGGNDTQLVWYYADTFSKTRPRKLSPFPQTSIVSIAPARKLLVLQKDQALDFWSVLPADSFDLLAEGKTKKLKPDEEHNAMLLQMKINGDSNIACTAISPNGDFLVTSTATELKFFSLSYENGSVTPTKMQVEKHLTEPANAVAFSPNSDILVIAAKSGEINVVDIVQQKGLASLTSSLKEKDLYAVRLLSFSSDGQWLSSASISGTINVFNLDTLKLYATLPKPDGIATAMTFCTAASKLVVATTANELIAFDVESKTVSAWTSTVGKKIVSDMEIRDHKVKGILCNPDDDSKVILYNEDLFLSTKLVDALGPMSPSPAKRARKTRNSQDENAELPPSDFAHQPRVVVKEYRPILFVDFLAKDEVVVIETPWLKIVQNLPDVLYRHRFGGK